MSNRQPVRRFIIFMLFAAWASGAGIVWAQSSSFSYQGSLTNGANPANGLHDFQFKLFDALTGGTQISLTNTATNLSVTNGLFKVTLDFGASAFPGAPRWLEISVRPIGGGAYTTLSPRQPISATPYAVKSLSAASADGLSAVCFGCVTGAQIGSLPIGNGNYIQNTAAPQPNSNFNISGNGTAAGTLSANTVNATAQYNLANTRVLGVGNRSTFAGWGAGTAITSGLGNSFFGHNTGAFTTSGSRNAFFGDSAGLNNTLGSRNTYFGEAAGYENTVGTDNAFFGFDAGFSNTASGNAFFGAFAGNKNMAGFSNAFFGKDAGRENTSGSFNSFFGSSAGKLNSTGVDNSFFGSGAGQANTIGHSNSFFGYGAGSATVDGDSNAFFGHLAGVGNVSGNGNTFVGYSAGNPSDTGSDNTFVGKLTGLGNLGGINNTLLGVNANVGQANLINATAIGANAQVNSNNAMVLGDSTVASYRVGIGTNTPFDKFHVTGDIRIGTNGLGCVKDADGTVIAGTCFSDLRFKRDIAPFPNLLDKLVRLQPVNFFWRSSEFPQRHFGTEQSYGLIAQEVEAVLPELVSTDAEGFKAVNYSKLPLLLLQGIKEQQQLSQQLKQENTELKQQLAAQQLRAQQQEREVRRAEAFGLPLCSTD